MTNQQQIFDSWYNRQGHWMYTREQAIKVWMTKGIEGLPRYKAGA